MVDADEEETTIVEFHRRLRPTTDVRDRMFCLTRCFDRRYEQTVLRQASLLITITFVEWPRVVGGDFASSKFGQRCA